MLEVGDGAGGLRVFLGVSRKIVLHFQLLFVLFVLPLHVAAVMSARCRSPCHGFGRGGGVGREVSGVGAERHLAGGVAGPGAVTGSAVGDCGAV